MTLAEYMASKGGKKEETVREVESEFKNVQASKKVEEDFFSLGGGKQKKNKKKQKETQTIQANFRVVSPSRLFTYPFLPVPNSFGDHDLIMYTSLASHLLDARRQIPTVIDQVDAAVEDVEIAIVVVGVDVVEEEIVVDAAADADAVVDQTKVAAVVLMFKTPRRSLPCNGLEKHTCERSLLIEMPERRALLSWCGGNMIAHC